MTQQPFTIGRSSGACVATGRAFSPGDRRVTALVEREPAPGEPEGLERLDFCERAWDDGHRPERLFGFWRSVVPEPHAKAKLLIDDDQLLALFEQMGEEAPQTDSVRREAFRFVLALLLVRKRLLRHEGGRREAGRAIMLVRSRGPEGWDPASPLVEVADPELDESSIEMVSEMLGQALRGEE